MEKVLQLIKDCKEKDGYCYGYVDGAEELENVLEGEIQTNYRDIFSHRAQPI